MLNHIQTPLPPVQHNRDKPLTLWTTLGVVAELSITHSEASQRTVTQWTHRIVPALESGQAHIFLDDDQRPWGYASWAVVDQAQHERWLSGESELPASWSPNESGQQPHYLWFVDLLAPYCSTLPMLQPLHQALAEHKQAWTFDMNVLGDPSEHQSAVSTRPQPRRLW